MKLDSLPSCAPRAGRAQHHVRVEPPNGRSQAAGPGALCARAGSGGRALPGPSGTFQSALDATQGQIDGFFSQLPYKCQLEEVASVGDSLEICPWVASSVASGRYQRVLAECGRLIPPERRERRVQQLATFRWAVRLEHDVVLCLRAARKRGESQVSCSSPPACHQSRHLDRAFFFLPQTMEFCVSLGNSRHYAFMSPQALRPGLAAI